jgi:uracil-DNA glycosylase family 4
MQQLSPAKGRSRNDYHNGPVSGFGALDARICLVGLAPGAHGANRTGRPFTGDGAGDFMYPLLHQAGFASQPEAVAEDDGLELTDLYITNAVKCLPPGNKPIAAEFKQCRSYLDEEIKSLKKLQVVIALGRGAHESLLRLFVDQGLVERITDIPFTHAGRALLPNGIFLVSCYHTSRYNVQTGRITEQMFLALLDDVQGALRQENG